MLAKILRRSFFPLNSDNDSELRSDFTSENSGAMVPFEGRFPDVLTGAPLNVIFAMTFFSKLVKLFTTKKHHDLSLCSFLLCVSSLKFLFATQS
jgi:hypothetical protein